MAVARKREEDELLAAHRQEMTRLGREVNERAGISERPGLTAEQLQERMREKGIRPEDNILSSEILRMR